ncbi:cupin domain-containing protein [Mucilaginibacter glaciei]|uniref:Cupin domain-containing protein n=1 Tax=Mucilaginibacter glaciei TaxID=2772109 RepID=A0A926NZZ8_9SPHI|nr:cupin domain-containing protein [Mucilaginibacter glaciei]MBD1395083.1 cupin domain-containing protein [Mucilaginibacter glaciei]
MKRRNFLLAGAVSIPALAMGKTSGFKKQRLTKGFIVKANESRFNEKTMLSGNSPNDIKVSTKDTDGDLSAFSYTGHVKGGPPLHVHPNQDEMFFILEGKFLFQVGEDQYYLTKGDSIFLPRNVPHTFAQLTDSGQVFFLFQPAGKMEDFFRAAGDIKARLNPKLFDDHDIHVVGPPLKW